MFGMSSFTQKAVVSDLFVCLEFLFAFSSKDPDNDDILDIMELQDSKLTG